MTHAHPLLWTVFCVGAVEIGFVNSTYAITESESSVVVCVEVKSGELTPAETALATVSTTPGTASGIVRTLYTVCHIGCTMLYI